MHCQQLVFKCINSTFSVVINEVSNSSERKMLDVFIKNETLRSVFLLLKVKILYKIDISPLRDGRPGYEKLKLLMPLGMEWRPNCLCINVLSYANLGKHKVAKEHCNSFNLIFMCLITCKHAMKIDCI